MPKERRAKSYSHDKSVRLSKREFVTDGSVELVSIGGMQDMSGNEIMAEISAESSKPTMKKKEKQQLKHELFLQRLESMHTPYSKSHSRRLKRKARDEVGNGMKDIELALPDLEDEDTSEHAEKDGTSEAAKRIPNRGRLGLIGEGKSEPLRKNQRQRVLKTEKIRHPLLISTPEFKSNPFQAIRTHAQNTLVKHKA